MRNYFWVFCFALLSACNSKTKQSDYVAVADIELQHEDGYVGDSKCIECHKGVYDTWKGSDHDLAMQVANDSTVLGDFNNVKTILDGVSYEFTRVNGDFNVHIKEIDGSETDYKIDYTFGVQPLQQYLVDFEKGRKQVLRVTWDTEKKRWFHQYGDDTISPHDWLHWTESAQNWNTMCAECHSTNLKKNYDADADAFATSYSVINVSCESCHGPAERHVYWAERHQENIPVANTYLISGKGQFSQMNMCAPCHARRAKLTPNLEPGKLFEDQYLLQNISSDYYHGDGQIDEEDYVYGSFLQSKMYHSGVTCTDCHDAHSLKRKADDNSLCMQCHVPKYDTVEHHFHTPGTEGAQCINCHMTGATYMGNDFRRDHSFRVPRPDQSVAYGTPNACTGCHEDKSDKWAAKQIITWYGADRADHFSDGLLVSNLPKITKADRERLDAYITNLDYPAIARSTVINNLRVSNSKQVEVLLKGLKDPSPLVRYNTLQKFRAMSPLDRIAIASEHLNDTTKLVRIGAVQLLNGVDPSLLKDVNQANLNNARQELETMLFTNADFSTGRLQLGDYYLQNQDYHTAIKHYKEALKKDSLLMPVYSNLATTYSLVGENDNAKQTLNTWIKKEPNSARPYYLRALLQFELKANEAAVSDLKMAVKLDPEDSRSKYNLATYYFQNKNIKQAENYIRQALELEPNNPDYNYLLALIYKEQGKTKESKRLMMAIQIMQGQS
ncbi:tetratricopeptide repeat protein [Formosa sp. S-31]|uniref:tetratricopeptide repeat protein n=1 Tax=Formosa sp. S-31 TaxID=2790949 RepID=UPI003EBFA813